jgi:hypothetical protein
MGCHPAIESWEDDATADDARVAAWWRRLPHTVLLATGWKFDVLDVPAAVGLRALGAAPLLARAGGPIAVTPAGRWMFLVRPGLALRAELDRCPGVVRHGRGSWVPAAPSRMPEGPVRWAVSPDQAGWRIPEPAGVQAILVDALAALDRRRVAVPAVAVPRQLSTARRAA